MEKDKKKKKKKERILMPMWLNIILTIASKIMLFFKTGIRYNRKTLKNHKDGFLLVYNHYSNQDHFFIKASLNFRRVSYVVASCFLLTKPVGTLLRLANAISKEQFKPDLVAIRKIKKVLDKKGIVAIAPTGQITIDGKPSYMSPAIVKLVKLAKADVVAMRTHGAHLTFPKWRTSKRSCKVTSEFVTVLKKEELTTLTDEEILRRIEEAIHVDEFAEQRTLKRKIHTKRIAEGLENIFIRCPKCGKKYSYESHKNECHCTECGNALVMDQFGFMHPKTEQDKVFEMVSEWMSWQKQVIGKELEDGIEFNDECEYMSNLINPKKLEICGSGKVVLKKDEFYIEGKLLDEEIKKEFKLPLIPQLPYDPGRRFEIPNEEFFLRVVPTNKKKVFEFVQCVDYLNDQRNQ